MFIVFLLILLIPEKVKTQEVKTVLGLVFLR